MLFSADRPGGIVTRKSDFSLEAFAWERSTLYVMIPEEKLPVYKAMIRVFVGCALNAITRQKTYLPTYRTTFVIDEAAALGHVPELETGVGYLAGYASLLLVFQDFSQIEQNFPKARSIVGNAAALVCFGVRDIETAKKISEMIGVKNQITYSEGVSKASTAVFDRQDSAGFAETGRALLDPAEILRMKDHEALIFMDRVRFPIRARKIRYWKEWRFFGRWDRWRVRRPAAPPSPTGPLSPQA
jgi:type IV secretion system protein VirD4